jgi:hypothetical protein
MNRQRKKPLCMQEGLVSWSMVLYIIYSKKSFNRLLRLGCRNLRNALASI